MSNRGKWIQRLFFIVLLLVIFVGYPWYNINHPDDATVGRMLQVDTIVRYGSDHLVLWGVAILIAIIIGVSAGVLISRPYFRFIAPVVVNVANVGQTVPSLGVLAIFMGLLGMGFNTAVFALIIYGILPILRNTYAGIITISPGVIEAARGMGMKPLRILSRIELPLALPVIMAGIRTSSVMIVGAATLATFIAAGGLGAIIVTGMSVMRDQMFYTGAVMAASLAILLDYILRIIEQEV